jgi:Formate hydrogenlyase subunit 6/NADH:ubiquinone oxidoreductase 23 kD subunit (chain I)
MEFLTEVETMAYIINDDCIACGACADECPTSCISEKDGKYIINKDECIDCGTCADTCPVGAPKAE